MIDSPVEIHELSETSELPRVKLEYPYVRILELSEAIPLIISNLPDGDLSLIASMNGMVNKFRSIERSPKTLYKLVRLSKLEYAKSPTEKYTLTDGRSILEMGSL